ncbi:MAG TPA: hypothetical protein VKU40_09095, partial [Thermoanaerobaculia bacterium]|nr:hypothetical protein [Thermoanaerobaculia bacterium]
VTAGLCEGIDGLGSLAANLPADVDRDPLSLPDPADRQRLFDCLSWRTFVALNWPAEEGCRGVPDLDASIADGGETLVWETFKEVYEVFQSQDAGWNLDDRPWSTPQPSAVCSEMAGDRKVLRMDTKQRSTSRVPDVANETEQAFAGGFGTLVDQTPELVRYEVRFNRDEFEYIRDNAFAETANYSYGGPKSGDVTLPDNTTGFQGHGAIEIKAAWKILGPDDDPGRFLTREVIVYDPRNEEQCSEATAGLVGLHVAHKTHWAPQWVWSTFEQVDNVPPAAGPEAGVAYSFFDPECTAPPASTCAPIVQPILTAEARCCANLQLSPKVFSFPTTPNQVTRIDPIGPTDLNATFQEALVDTPFANYALVNTQWPSGGRTADGDIAPRPCNPDTFVPIQPVDSGCYEMVPQHLRNTSMETYMVTYGTGLEPTSSTSCMECHASAGVDASYVWLDAQLQPLPIGE